MDSAPWGIPPGLFPDRGARVRLHGRFDRSRGMPVAVDEPADDLDRHGPNMRAGIFRQQFHRPRKNLGLLRLARSLLTTIASQCVQCRDPHALIGVVQHCEQVRQRVGLQGIDRETGSSENARRRCRVAARHEPREAPALPTAAGPCRRRSPDTARPAPLSGRRLRLIGTRKSP